jgi:Starch-binding associating with outer membrane
MKKFLSFFLIGGLLLTATGCDNFVDGYDVSPNSPSDATLAILTTGVQVGVIANYTTLLPKIASVLTQQQAGKQFQFDDLQKYDIDENTADNSWLTLYRSGFNNSTIIINKAGDTNKYYRGIARVMKAMTLGLVTDVWGDAPNKEAGRGLEGEQYFSMAYDSQESILQDIQALIDGAIQDFGSTEEANVMLPGVDDLFFGGDMKKWRLAAGILKARYANRLSKRDAKASATATLAALDAAYAAGLKDGSSDLMAQFGQAANEWNPWNAFNKDRGGYMTGNTFFINLLKDDPRLPLYAKKNAAGVYDDSQPLGDYYGALTAPLPLLTFFEAKFIEAEAALRADNKTRAAKAFNEAVKANLSKLEVKDAAFETRVASETDATISLEKIMTQKYIAMFTQVEVWSDWRRTDFPKLKPNAGALINQIPRRLPTTNDEVLYNPKAVVVTDAVTPMWWDK